MNNEKKLSPTLLKEKDIELLNDFKIDEYLSQIDDDIVIEMHTYDLAGNKIYSKHEIERSTYELNSISTTGSLSNTTSGTTNLL